MKLFGNAAMHKELLSVDEKPTFVMIHSELVTINIPKTHVSIHCIKIHRNTYCNKEGSVSRSRSGTGSSKKSSYNRNMSSNNNSYNKNIG